MGIETVMTCPLGSKCEEIKDNKLHRCTWYQSLAGQDPTTGEQVNEWRCAIVWQNIVMVETSMTNRSIAAATESFRNEMVKAQENFNNIMLAAAEQHRLLNNEQK